MLSIANIEIIFHFNKSNQLTFAPQKIFTLPLKRMDSILSQTLNDLFNSQLNQI